MCSPCSEDSIDSDDLTSESSQDATSQDAGYEEDDESESCNYNKKSRTTTTTNNEKLSNGSSNTKVCVRSNLVELCFSILHKQYTVSLSNHILVKCYSLQSQLPCKNLRRDEIIYICLK